MRDYGASVLEQYPVTVENIRRVRGALLCETDQGIMLLKETRMSDKRLPFYIEIYKQMEEAGMKQVDVPVANKEGGFITEAEDETRYMLKKWYLGKECDIYSRKELTQSVQALASLHKILRIPGEEIGSFRERNLQEEYHKHNRELRKVFTFARRRSLKGDFERIFLKGYEQMYYYAKRAEECLEQSVYQSLEKQAKEQGMIVHGEYNYHNLLFTAEGIAITGFERSHCEIQLEDLYYFMRKVLEKHQYSEKLGEEMIQAYNSILPLNQEETEYLAIRFAYPEKFWKITNLYYHSKKAWIPEKDVEKLKKTISQSKERIEFLEKVFGFRL